MNNITIPFIAILFWTYFATILGSDKQRRVPGNDFNPIGDKISAPNYSNLNKNTSPKKLMPSSGSSQTIPKQLFPGESSSSEKSYKQISPKEPNISKAQITNKSLSGKLAYDVQTSKGNQKKHQDSTENPMNQPNLKLKQINLRPKNKFVDSTLSLSSKQTSTSQDVKKLEKISERSSKNSDVPRRIAALINSIHMCENLKEPAFQISNDRVYKKIADIIQNYEITEETRRIYEMSSNADMPRDQKTRNYMDANLRGICMQLGNILNTDEKVVPLNMGEKGAQFFGRVIERNVMIKKKVDKNKKLLNLGACNIDNIRFSILLGPKNEDRSYYLLSISTGNLDKVLEHFYTKPTKNEDQFIRMFQHYSNLPRVIDEWLGKSKESDDTLMSTSLTRTYFHYLLPTPPEIPDDRTKNSENLKEICQRISAFTKESGNQFIYKGFKYLGHSDEHHAAKMYNSGLFINKIKPYGVCDYQNQQNIYVYLADRTEDDEAYLLALADKKYSQRTVVLDGIYITISRQIVHF